MSGVNSWLQRQRKTDLAELAQHTGLKNYESFKKNELELALDEYLADNATQFESDPKLQGYYASRARTIGSPVKRNSVDSVTDKLKVAKRRATKALEELTPSNDEEATSSALVQTPGRTLSLRNRVHLPATPRDVANAMDRSAVAVRNRVASMYKESGITEATHRTRESLSTVTSVLFLIAAFEAYFLRSEVLPDRYAFTIPAIPILRTSDYPVHIPDLFLLLTTQFWVPVFTWFSTSLFVPTLFGYFFNLTSTHTSVRATRRSSAEPEHVVDPLTFSIVKALLAFVVYGQKVTFGGWIDEESIARINGAVYGGWKGIVVGSAISGLLSIYDAVLKK